MAETYHEDMRDHLGGLRNALGAQLAAVQELEANASKYLVTERAALVGTIKAPAVHAATCAVCSSYEGNPKP